MLTNTNDESAQLRAKAFENFKKVAEAEQANGAENLALFRLVSQFSTAPKDETDSVMICMRYWSRNGHGQWLAEAGQELFNWSRDNGYHHT